MKDLTSYLATAFLNKRIIITGGSTGIGRETAILLASWGARCLICGRHQEQIDETLNSINQQNGVGCAGIATDLATEAGIDELFAFADTKLGGLDIFVNNAGLSYRSILEGSYQQWQYILNTNLLSYMACAAKAVERMEGQGGGHIINIGSMSAETKQQNSSVYVATKSAIRGFTSALRKEINPLQIKVSLVEPGAVDTDMQEGTKAEKMNKIQKKEMLPASDIALSIAFCIAQSPGSDIVSLQIRPNMQLI